MKKFIFDFFATLFRSQTQVSVAHTLTYMRNTPTLDYDHDDSDSPRSKLIRFYQQRMDELQKVIEADNAQRIEDGLLPYRYLIPDQVPASTST